MYILKIYKQTSMQKATIFKKPGYAETKREGNKLCANGAKIGKMCSNIQIPDEIAPRQKPRIEE